jgi:hypothetical protein
MRWMTGLLTECSHLKVHISKLELLNKPTYDRCLDKDKTAPHVLCDYTAMVYKHLGTSFYESISLFKSPIKQTTAFHLKCGAVSSLTKKMNLQQTGNNRCERVSITHSIPVH